MGAGGATETPRRYHYNGRPPQAQTEPPKRAQTTSADRAAKAPSRPSRADRAQNTTESAKAEREQTEPQTIARKLRRRRAEDGRKLRADRERVQRRPSRRRRAGTEKRAETIPTETGSRIYFEYKTILFSAAKLRAGKPRRPSRRRSPQKLRRRRSEQAKRANSFNIKLKKTDFQFFLIGRVIVRVYKKIEKRGILTREKGI